MFDWLSDKLHAHSHPNPHEPSPCAEKCVCQLAEKFRYRDLPELVGKKVTLKSMTSVPDDVRDQISLPFKVGKFVDYVDSKEPLPGYAGILWKHRRAELVFEIDDEVHCGQAGREIAEEFGFHIEDIFLHSTLMADIEQRGDGHVLVLSLENAAGIRFFESENREVVHRGAAMILVTHEEAPPYWQALDQYCHTYRIKPRKLTFHDGVKCFLGRYLPQEFVITGAGITNVASVVPDRVLVM